MFQYNDPDKGKKYFFDKSPKFWDKLVNGLFILGILIVIFVLIFNWLGFFDSYSLANQVFHDDPSCGLHKKQKTPLSISTELGSLLLKK